MYIALRWLIGLSLGMWVAMCCIDVFNESGKTNPFTDFHVNIFRSENMTSKLNRRISVADSKKYINREEQQNTAMLHYAMFFAGALAVSVFNKKNEILLYTRRKIIHVNIYAANFIKDKVKFKRTATQVGVAILQFSIILLQNCRSIVATVIEKVLLKRAVLQSHKRINLELLQKLKDYRQEQNNLGQILISAIRENKNIRMRFQLETIAKRRLMQHIEDIEKQMKENRSKYVSFQHLYLVTHQENIFLKSRLKKVSKDKEEAERNLITLVNKIYQSQNNELKAYCSRFIVRTRENLLNSDVSAEIQKFLCRNSTASSSDISDSSRITEFFQDGASPVPLVSGAPKLRGLPGECIWTVKDKDGIIEKLYEYDVESVFDNGDTIQRIRKYSVYYDKDCLLDYLKSKSSHCDISLPSTTQQHYIKVEYPFANHRFLTGSQAFQKFLQDNKNFLQISQSQTPALKCE